jgi:signal transduction histidine kinase
VDELRTAETRLGLFPSDTLRDTLDARIVQVSSLADSLGQFGLSAATDSIHRALRDVREYATREYEAGIAGRGAEADSISATRIMPAIARADLVLRAAEGRLRTRIGNRVNMAEQATGEAWQLSLLGFVAAGALAVVIAVLLWRIIADPIRDLEAGLAAVADGNFGHHLTVSPDRPDEFGRLARSFDSMARQLAQLDRLKAEFISVASHELKTPINVILGYVQLLQEGVYGAVTPKQRDILRTLEAQTTALSRLVHQLLDVSRFEAGGGKLDLRAVDLDGFLRELQHTFDVLSVQRGVHFRIERSGPLAAEVYWDPDRMSEVLGNLLSNAFKFTEAGGAVELLVEGVDGEVHLTVRDTGAGIPPEQLPHIFEKFYQASNQEAATHRGTGLGLAIAKQIVVAHGGAISVDSTIGVGTTFVLALPTRAGGRVAIARRDESAGVPV